MTETNEAREKAIQANEIAGIVIGVLEPEIFAPLDLRYGIADAVWDAGYRKAEK